LQPVVVNSNIIAASFLASDRLHQQGRTYIDGLEAGDYVFHLPMLVIVEVTSAIRRQAEKHWLALLSALKQSVVDWEQDGKLVLYTLDRGRMDASVNIAERDRLKGADAVIAALAEELDMPLKTFDSEILDRFAGASA
jgi:predicted nucleic acid-binding protein